MPKNVQEEPIYQHNQDAQAVVAELVKIYNKILFAVNPATVIVIGCVNKSRPVKSRKLATITKPSPQIMAVFKHFNVPITHVIHIYFSDWNVWSEQRRQWILFHELLHIPKNPNAKLVEHDIEDFGGILAEVGLNWTIKAELPSLLGGENPYPFKPELFNSLHIPIDAEEIPPDSGVLE